MSKYLEDIFGLCVQNGYNIYRFAEIKDGNDPQEIAVHETNACQNSYSVAKVFVVTAIGMLVDRGLLTPQDNALSLAGVSLPKGADERYRDITVHQLLTHRAGLPDGCLDIDSYDSTEFGTDFLAHLFTLPLVCDPDAERHYSDGAYYWLARIAEKFAGENLSQFLWRELFAPLGFREAAWSTDPQGHCIGATGLYIRSSDAVKLGEIYLEGGTYRDRRYLSEEWVKTVLSVPYELAPQNIGHIYGKGGMNGQFLAVDPDKKRVIAWHGFRNIDTKTILQFTAEYEKCERIAVSR